MFQQVMKKAHGTYTTDYQNCFRFTMYLRFVFVNTGKSPMQYVTIIQFLNNLPDVLRHAMQWQMANIYFQ